MSDIIQLLPEHIANQIAAGEVVQRPSSVVKELLENAIDAGATHIKLIIKEAGKSLIQVVDDGLGMSETDARMAFERHATSKIRVAEDLFNLHTMGFRGEALASIAAVAQVELRTRQRSQEVGIRIQIEGSQILAQEPCQTAVGSSMSVKNLFFNIPARRNFLKSNQIEMQHISQEFERIALANPDIFFSLHHNDEQIHHLPRTNLRQRIVHLFGNKVNPLLIPMSEQTDVLEIHGFVSKPEGAKKSRGEQFFFVNNRYIKSSYLHHAIMNAYEDLLPANLQPLYVIFLKIDPARIDVNVHPTKQEIKFEDERLIYNYLRVTARHALAQHNITPSLDFEAEVAFSNPDANPNPSNPATVADVKTQHSFSDNFNPNKGGSNSAGSGKSSPAYTKFSSPLEESNLKNWELLYKNQTAQATQTDTNPDMEKRSSQLSNLDAPAPPPFTPQQVNQKYILTSTKSGLLLIDQKAAHQRIIYEECLQMLEQERPNSQQKLFPQVLTFSATDALLLKELLPMLTRFGIDVKELGKNSFIVHGLPAIWDAQPETQILEQLLEQYKQNLPLHLDLQENIARSIASRTAIPATKKLSVPEMQSIIDRLFGCQQPYTSPSGGKTMLLVEWANIDTQFE